MSDDSTTPSRRGVLQTVAGATAVGSVPTAAAAERPSLAERKRRLAAQRDIEGDWNSQRIRATFRRETASIRETLADSGYVESAALSEFTGTMTTTRDITAGEFSTVVDGIGMMTAYSERADTATAHLYAATRTPEAAIELHVRPEADVAIAIVADPETGEASVVGPEDSTVGTACSCTKDCDVACNYPGGPIVFQVCEDTGCTDTTWDCTRSANCDECPDQSGCGGGW